MDLERKISLNVRNACWKQYFAESWMKRPNSGISERQVVLYTRKEAAKTPRPIRLPVRLLFGERSGCRRQCVDRCSVVEKGTTNGTATDANGL